MFEDYYGLVKRPSLVCAAALFLLGGSLPMRSQNHELAAGVGRGLANADDIQTVAASLAGVSFKTRLGRPELKLDYNFLFGRDFFPNGLHVVSGLWFIQSKTGPIRPFVELGAAAAYYRQGTRAEYLQPDGTIHAIESTEARFLAGPATGAGLTVDLSKRIFLRPEIRLNVLAGSTIMTTLVPIISVGYRFGGL